jgi:hypothetical protein
VWRGGSFNNNRRNARSSYRNNNQPDEQNQNLGFRVAGGCGTDRSGELKPEYRFDYAKAKLNRFAANVRVGSVAVLLDPDVARVFGNAESVNTVLQTLLTVMPARRTRETR